MDRVLIDTDILVDHLRGIGATKRYLKRIESGEIEAYISVITVAELSAGRGWN